MELIELLVLFGADLNAQDMFGRTPFDVATQLYLKDSIDYINKLRELEVVPNYTKFKRMDIFSKEIAEDGSGALSQYKQILA